MSDVFIDAIGSALLGMVGNPAILTALASLLLLWILLSVVNLDPIFSIAVSGLPVMLYAIFMSLITGWAFAVVAIAYGLLLITGVWRLWIDGR